MHALVVSLAFVQRKAETITGRQTADDLINRAGNANLPGLFEKTLKRKENFHLGQVLFRKLLHISERCERLGAVASQIGNHFRSHFKREWDCLRLEPSLHYANLILRF